MSKLPSKSGGIGRPPSKSARSHAAIMDAVYELLLEGSVRDLTMEAIAKRAKVGKPTLYKWWPTKAALIMAMFNERLVGTPTSPSFATVEEALQAAMRRLVMDYNGPFGKVMADLIAEGQSDPALLQELNSHIRSRRVRAAAQIERGRLNGEFSTDTDVEFAIDAVFGPTFYRLLLGFPMTKAYADRLIAQVLRGMKPREMEQPYRRKARSQPTR